MPINYAQFAGRFNSAYPLPTGDEPFTNGDFTGRTLIHQFLRGFQRQVVESCDGAVWTGLEWDGVVAGESSITFWMRVSEDESDLAAAEWIGPWTETADDLTEVPGPLPAGRYLELEAMLVAESGGTVPYLRTVAISFDCP